MPIKSLLFIIIFSFSITNIDLFAENENTSSDQTQVRKDSDAQNAKGKNTVNSVQESELEKDNTINNNFNIIFKYFVDEEGMVNYSHLRRKRSKLISLVRALEKLELNEFNSWTTEEQVAFWLNSYNLCTISLIIDNYPIEPSRLKLIFYPANSIMQLKNAWTQNYFNIMGREYTLKEIEQNLPLIYNDPKIFLALSYASYSSAPLRNEPYLGHKLDKQLEDQAKKFVAKSQTFSYDNDEGTIYLTDVFNWYKKSFVEAYKIDTRYRTRSSEIRAYLNFLQQYLPEDQTSVLDRTEYEIKFAKYDWRLNETKEPISNKKSNK